MIIGHNTKTRYQDSIPGQDIRTGYQNRINIYIFQDRILGQDTG
jgi:hypothetical protein